MTEYVDPTIQEATEGASPIPTGGCCKMRSLGCLALLWMAGMAQAVEPAAPPKLEKPGKKVRFISLAEARAIALEQGSTGQPSLLSPGAGHENSIKVPQG